MTRYKKSFKLEKLKAGEVKCIGHYDGDIRKIDVFALSDYRPEELMCYAMDGSVYERSKTGFVPLSDMCVSVEYER